MVVAAFAVREFTLRPGLSLAVAALVASIPVFGFFGGTVNNDNMLNLFAVATLLCALRLVRSPTSMLLFGSLLLGALEGGALLSKASGIALIPVGLLALGFAVARSHNVGGESTRTGGQSFLAMLRKGDFWRSFLGLATLYLLALLVVDGWMMLYNLREYGDLFGTANTIKSRPTCWGPTISSQGAAGVLRYLLSLALLTPFSFLATFGSAYESIGTALYYALILPFLLVAAYFSIRWLRRRFSTLPAFQQMDLLVLAALTLANMAIWIALISPFNTNLLAAIFIWPSSLSPVSLRWPSSLVPQAPDAPCPLHLHPACLESTYIAWLARGRHGLYGDPRTRLAGASFANASMYPKFQALAILGDRPKVWIIAYSGYADK